MTSSTEELAQKAEQALTFIKNHPDGIVQSELWKELGIDSRTCSRILKHLEDEGKIQRQAAKGNTFLVTWVKQIKKLTRCSLWQEMQSFRVLHVQKNAMFHPVRCWKTGFTNWSSQKWNNPTSFLNRNLFYTRTR